jgi:hypothetical protein
MVLELGNLLHNLLWRNFFYKAWNWIAYLERSSGHLIEMKTDTCEVCNLYNFVVWKYLRANTLVLILFSIYYVI